MAFTIPNVLDAFNANQAEIDSKDIDIFIKGSSKTGTIVGCAVTEQAIPDMTVTISFGRVVNGGIARDVPFVASLAIGAADVTNPRFDLVTVDLSGVVSVVAGTPLPEPVFPAIPASRVVLAAIYVQANETTILNNRITDKRTVIDLKSLDRGGQVFNVKAYGAVGDGITDDTVAIQTALTAAAAVGGTVLFPHGIFNTTGNFDLSLYSGVGVEGAIGSHIRLTHATNSLFKWSTENVGDLLFRNLDIISDTVVRTDGWVIEGAAAYDDALGTMFFSRIENVRMHNQVNGIKINRYIYVWISDCFFDDGVGSGIAFQMGQAAATDINQGSELYLDRCQVFGDFASPSEAFHIEDCEAVYMNTCGGYGIGDHTLKMVAGSHGLHNHFFNKLVTDAGMDHAAVVTGSGTANNLMFTGCWFASAGQAGGGSAAANGLRIEATTTGAVQLTGCTFINNKGSGLYIDKSGRIAVTGCNFDGNGGGATVNNNYGMYFNASAPGGPAPIIVGCEEQASNGSGLRLDANADKAIAIGNRWASGVTYTVLPQISALNVNAGVPGTSRFTGRIAAARSSLTLVNGDNNDVALPASSFARITGPTAAFAVTGIVAGGDGDEMRLFNSVAQTMTISNESASSTAANRITTLTGGDVVLRATAPSFAILIYDASSARWVLENVN